MRIGIKKLRHTLFPKLVIALLAVIAPLYILGLSINKQLESSVERELTYSLESRINYYTDSLVVEKSHIMNLLQEFALDRDVQRLSFNSKYMSIYEWSEAVMRIRTKLQMIQNSSTHIGIVKAHLLTINRTLSSNSPIEPEITDDYEAVKPEPDLKLERQGFTYWQDRMFLRFAYPESIVPRREPEFVVAVEFNKDSLRKALKQFALYPNSGALLYDPEQHMELENETDAAATPQLESFLDAEFAAGVQKGSRSLSINGARHIVAYEYAPSLGSYFVMYIPYREVFGTIESNRIYYWLLSAIAAIVIVGYSYWLYRLIHKPLLKLVQSFRRIENGQLETIVLPRSNDEFRYLYNQFNRMTDQLGVLIHQVYEHKLRAQSSELKQLQSQINPHFLYNTYFILHRLVDMDDRDNALLFSRYLGEYFQYITRNASTEVPFEQEYQQGTIYAAIQNIRFSDRIRAEFAPLPPECAKLEVPKLILQPVIENAYKYGLEHKARGGLLRVAAFHENDGLTITIEDNGDRLTDEKLAELKVNLIAVSPDMEYTGLLNVHRRLQIRYANSGVAVDRGEWGGMKVTLRIAAGGG
ncbi:histidine kinase [Cohnella sp. GCM10027633]|uniref:sensor histidine kinase n=1 Tax=unclassified Cohnella TaxID=2636738 RepID=UPI003641951F